MNKTPEVITINSINLYPKQLEIANAIIKSKQDTKLSYHTILASRQSGKSIELVQLLMYFAINIKGARCLYCTLSYSQASKVYEEILFGLQGTGLIKRTVAVEHSIYLENGSVIYFKSTRNADSILGYAFSHVFMDEFSRYPDLIFDGIVRQTMKVLGRICIMVSTPKGKNNHFYKFYQLGINNEKGYHAYKINSDENPYRNQEEIDIAKLTLPENIYRQEYEGEFIDDGGDVFSNVKANSILTNWSNYNPNLKYFAGLDSGKFTDYFVLTLLDSLGNITFIYRDNRTDWNTMMDDAVTLLQKYKVENCIIESNNQGSVVHDYIKKRYPKVTAFNTNPDSKQNIIEALILAFQNNSIKIPTKELYEVLHNEIEDFSFSFSKSQHKIQYKARTGHDDTVVSLALSLQAKNTYTPAQKLSYSIL